MLSYPPFAQKAVQFMLKTGLLGQFEDLKGKPMRLWHGIGTKSRTKLQYRVEDETVAGVPPPQGHIFEDTRRPRKCKD